MSFHHPSRMIPPNAIQVGSGKTDTTGSATVTFPTPFPFPPKVFLQSVDAGARGIVLDVVSVSTTGFTVKARKVTGVVTGSVGDHTHSNPSTGVAGAHVHPLGDTGTDKGWSGSYVGSPGYPPFFLGRWSSECRESNQPANYYVSSLTADQWQFRNLHVHSAPSISSAGDHSHTVGSTGPAGGHAHSVDAPVLSVDFYWLAIGLMM